MDFKLRPWQMSDLDSLVEQANNWNIAKNLTDKFPFPYTSEDGQAFLDMTAGNDTYIIQAIEVEGKAIGSIGLFPQSDIHKPNAEMGYWIGETYWGQGIITKAIRQMVDMGFRTYDIDRIFARPFGSNLASQRVLEKAGFILEARLSRTLVKAGKTEDELIYAFRKERPSM